MSCFAGRRRYLEVLLVYVNELLDKGLVDEFHIWDYTRDPDDAVWVQENCKRYNIFQVQDKNTWKEYYEYYGNLRWADPMHVLIKCDDDIVFIDVEAFSNFIHNRIFNQQYLLAFPSIINNFSTFQVQATLGLWEDIDQEKMLGPADDPEAVHTAFLTDPVNFVQKSRAAFPQKFVLNNRSEGYININFFAILAKDIHIFNDCWNNDEMNLAFFIPKWLTKNNYIDPSFVVSHMAFTRQRDAGFDETPVLEQYKELAKTRGKIEGLPSQCSQA
jgi:hypothetical protein